MRRAMGMTDSWVIKASVIGRAQEDVARDKRAEDLALLNYSNQEHLGLKPASFASGFDSDFTQVNLQLG